VHIGCHDNQEISKAASSKGAKMARRLGGFGLNSNGADD
jgi:hypothetical protein